MITTLKTCKRCAVERPRTDFYRHARMTDGLLSFCKDCTTRRVATHREKNLVRINAYDRQRYRDNPKRQQQLKNWFALITPAQKKCNQIINNAIRDGRLTRPPACWHCGNAKPESHHAYYDVTAPYDVTWLCRSCHCKTHAMNRIA